MIEESCLIQGHKNYHADSVGTTVLIGKSLPDWETVA